MLCILTVHLNLSLIYSQANSQGRESKQTCCLIRFGSQRVIAQGRFDFMSFSLIVERPEEVDAEV